MVVQKEGEAACASDAQGCKEGVEFSLGERVQVLRTKRFGLRFVFFGSLTVQPPKPAHSMQTAAMTRPTASLHLGSKHK